MFNHMSLAEHCNVYDVIAKTFYGFKNIIYPRNARTYAMIAETETLVSMVPQSIPQIPEELQLLFVRSGIAHEAGHLINAKSLIKSNRLLNDPVYCEDRNMKMLHRIFNILVDISHERCEAEKVSIDGNAFYEFWRTIEDNLWELEKLEIILSEDKEKAKKLQEEMDALNDLCRIICLTERNIAPKRIKLPDNFNKHWDNIDTNVLEIIRETYDSVKILDAAKLFYDIIFEELPNMKKQIEGGDGKGEGEKTKIKIVRIKGCPEGMSLGEDGIDWDQIDPDDVEIEEMDFDDYMDQRFGNDHEDYSAKTVKNQNSDDYDDQMKEGSDSSAFDKINEDNKEKRDERQKTTKGAKCDPKSKTPIKDPIHKGEGNKQVIYDYDLTENAVPHYDDYIKAKNKLTDAQKLYTLLRKHLISLSKDMEYRHQLKGRFDSRNMTRLLLLRGCKIKPVFKKTEYSTSYKKVVVTLLIDESGSMGSDSKYLHARMAAILFSEILDRMRIKFEVIGFSTAWGEARGSYPSCVNRNEPLHHIVYKSFNEKLIKTRLGGITYRANNCDGESLLFAARRIFRQTNSDRKIIFVFSDGYPNASTQYNMQDDLKNTVKLCTNSGIEVYGIGVCSDAVKQFYPDWLLISDSRHLPQEFYKKLSSVLSKVK